MTKPETIALIPARGGSKGLPGKNLRDFRGKPLLTHSIDVAKCVDRISGTFVSTDNQEIAAVAEASGAIVPGLRPEVLARDDTPMLDVLVHCLKSLKERVIGRIVLLQPTSPLRSADDVNACLSLFDAQRPDSVVTVTAVPHGFHHSKAMVLEDGFLTPVLGGSPEPGKGRQFVPATFARNGPAVAVLDPGNINKGLLYGERIVGYVMPKERSVDIDDAFDFFIAEAAAAFNQRSDALIV